MALDVDTILTDAELIEFLPNQATTGIELKPGDWDDLKPARQYALDRVLEAFRRRDPPIFEEDLQTPSQLKQVIRDGAAARLFRLAMTSGDKSDLFVENTHYYEELFTAGMLGLNPDLVDGQRGQLGVLTVSRR